VHGEYDVQLDFAKQLTERGFNVEVPGMNYVSQLT
jgi:hypothetical protein